MSKKRLRKQATLATYNYLVYHLSFDLEWLKMASKRKCGTAHPFAFAFAFGNKGVMLWYVM